MANHKWGEWIKFGEVWRRFCRVRHRDLGGHECQMVQERRTPPTGRTGDAEAD